MPTIPKRIQTALDHVRDHHPAVTLVVFNADGRWCYMDDEFTAPIFRDEVNQDLLDAAGDAAYEYGLPCVFEVPHPHWSE